AVVPGPEGRRRPRLLLPPHRVLRAGPGHHACRDPRRGDRAAERHRLRPHRRAALAGRGGDRALARARRGRQRLRQPAHHRRHRPPAVLRRVEASGVGPGAKAGGPNYVAQLGHFALDGLPTRTAEPGAEVRAALADLRTLVTDDAERTWLERAVGSDAAAWEAEVGQEQDHTGLRAEANIFRYRPVPVLVRTVPGVAPV